LLCPRIGRDTTLLRSVLTDTVELSAARQTGRPPSVTMRVVRSQRADAPHGGGTAMTYYYEASAKYLWYIGQPDAAGEAITASTAGGRRLSLSRRFFGEDAAAQRRMRGA
jgi:hypothetical protein